MEILQKNQEKKKSLLTEFEWDTLDYHIIISQNTENSQSVL